MDSIVRWARTNWAIILLVVIIIFLLGRSQSVPVPFSSKRVGLSAESVAMGAPSMVAYDQADDYGIAPPEPNVPPTTAPDRLVIKDTTVSMVVSNVTQALQGIESTASQFGGFLVNSNLTVPEGASSGSITIRVPADARDSVLDAITALGVRVISQHVSGHDVTDQFVDIQARLNVLEQTKTKFETLLDQGENVTELLQVQRELINIQSQIDSLRGQAQYLEQSAQLSRITVYLSTDELALPFAPDDAWRPTVVFKQAVRSLVRTVRNGIDSLIWIGVYGAVWIPVVLIIGVIMHARKRKK